MNWETVASILFALVGGAWAAGSALLKGGRILHEIIGLREDVGEIKSAFAGDRRETREAISEVKRDHRELERRVEVLEVAEAYRTKRHSPQN